MLYFLYRLGEIIINRLPLKAAYLLATAIADIKYFASIKDKRIIINNLKVIFGNDDPRLRAYARGVFRNFCKYLVDFFRQDQVDKEYIKKFIKVRGTEHLDEAFKKGEGVIMLSAHLGNWELGAAVMAMLGYPLNVIALSHRDKRINAFFDRRRRAKGVGVIPVGGSVKKAFKCLDRNEAVAVLADRDFSKSDLVVKFFGRDTVVPKGLGIFNLKKLSAIVPCFMVREKDDTYSYTFEKPLEINRTGSQDKDLKIITREGLKIIERYIRKYPDQWFMFSDLWPRKA